jgi:DNA replication protein DnaC
MRTEQQWNERFLQTALEKFPPRIQQDLKTISQPNDVKGLTTKSRFFFSNEVGTGKTIRASFMMLEHMKTKYLTNQGDFKNIHFISFPIFLSEIKRTYDRKNESEYEVIEKYITSELLLLDDFLVTRPTEWMLDIVYYLVNYRYEYLLPTLFTCNMDLQGIEEFLDDQRITRRINAMCEIEYKKPFWNNEINVL